jgi:FAD-dependent urate hydroxylase
MPVDRAASDHRLMEEIDPTTVLVIGGGIGGLAAALALRRVGASVHVFERVPELHEVGAGLGLWMNAVRVLDRLGVGAEIRAIGAPLSLAEVCSFRGAVLSRLELSEVVPGADAVNYVLHRADLHAALARQLPADVLRTASECVAVRQDETGVVASFAEGPPVRGALLVGADGLHSVVRPELWGRDRTRYSGQTCYRGVARLRVPDPHVLREVQGPGMRAAVCPLGADRVYWWAAINAEAGEPDEPAARRQHLLERFRGWPYLVPEAIAATEGPILRNDLVDRAPLKRWSRGRATLLGDAAHPMLPNLGQGACTAIEDALVLARAVSDHGPTPEALQIYERERIGRTTRIVRESWGFGVPARWRSGWAVRLREALIRSTPKTVMVRALRRHIDYDPGPLTADA